MHARFPPRGEAPTSRKRPSARTDVRAVRSRRQQSNRQTIWAGSRQVVRSGRLAGVALLLDFCPVRIGQSLVRLSVRHTGEVRARVDNSKGLKIVLWMPNGIEIPPVLALLQEQNVDGHGA